MIGLLLEFKINMSMGETLMWSIGEEKKGWIWHRFMLLYLKILLFLKMHILRYPSLSKRRFAWIYVYDLMCMYRMFIKGYTLQPND